MTKTVKNHIAEADQIKRHIDDANKLLEKCRKELADTRSTLEILSHFAPADHFHTGLPYHLQTDNRREGSMRMILEMQTKRINALLGDRA